MQRRLQRCCIGKSPSPCLVRHDDLVVYAKSESVFVGFERIAPNDGEAVSYSTLCNGATHVDDAATGESCAEGGLGVDVERLSVIVALDGLEVLERILCRRLADKSWERRYERAVSSIRCH